MCTQGQTFHYPPPWWVQSSSATPGAVALAGSMLTREGAPVVAQRLKDACAVRHKVPWDPEWGVDEEDGTAFCAAIEPCLVEWASAAKTGGGGGGGSEPANAPHLQPIDPAAQRRALINWIGQSGARRSRRHDHERRGPRASLVFV